MDYFCRGKLQIARVRMDLLSLNSIHFQFRTTKLSLFIPGTGTTYPEVCLIEKNTRIHRMLMEAL